MNEWINLPNSEIQIMRKNDNEVVLRKWTGEECVRILGPIPYCDRCYDALYNLFENRSRWTLPIDDWDISTALFSPREEDVHYIGWDNVSDFRIISDDINGFIRDLRCDAKAMFLWGYGLITNADCEMILKDLLLPDGFVVIFTSAYCPEESSRDISALII